MRSDNADGTLIALGDTFDKDAAQLDTPEAPTVERRIMYSILHDLIGMYRPELERQDAITKLLEDIDHRAG